LWIRLPGLKRRLSHPGENRMTAVRRFVLAALISSCVSCTNGDRATAQQSQPPNILLIIGDDMGIETLASFDVGTEAATTPRLNELASRGLRFDNFWSQPVCSPTRATLLTGRYGFRTGVGRPTGDGPYMGPMPETPAKPANAPAEGRGTPPAGGGGSPGLPVDEFTLPKAFAQHSELGYATAAFGKWHLADPENGWERHPNLVGFDHFSGLMRGFPEGYFAWTKVVDGEFSGETGYAPSDKIDDAISWIRQRGDQPWFAWLAFNLPHLPLHLPPESLWVNDYSEIDPQANPDENPRPYFLAMMEAMDTEIGRLLDSIDPAVLANTYVIFMGDNGTARQVVTAPFAPNHAKGGVYEGGVNVPLIISGPGVVAGRSTPALANSTDLFATVMQMASIDPATTVPASIQTDAVSLMPYFATPDRESIRDWIYADVFGPRQGVSGGQYAIRGQRYKLVVRNGNEEFYDLALDRSETTNLLDGALEPDQRAALEYLRNAVNELHASEMTE
jgi:arylsulfatase A-like enzyme